MKDLLRARFSAHPEKYYEVELFRREGFVRRSCEVCGKHFWTLDQGRKTCPESPCQTYDFIGNPPTKRRFTYTETWKQIEAFFMKNGHTSIGKYPVVCRWRPDLFFTVASIIDFQRVEGGKVVFELPANPLIVPQMCLRFNDVENVGVTGKHYTSFCMVGQHSVTGGGGYWKDRCIELDYSLLTGPFGIPPEEITFLEDVWLGYGAFGYSLEYHVRGLELGNAVFTEFEGTPSEYWEMKSKVIDMGAGLERFAWITQGTPTSYDCVFKPVVDRMIKRCGLKYDRDLFLRYSRLAGSMNIDEVSDIMSVKSALAKQLGISLEALDEKIQPVEALYAIADHTRSLVLAIADGALPSNVGGGYNLRVILRRALGFIDKWGWDLSLDDVAKWHIDDLKSMYPEIEEHRDEVITILGVEEKRYESMKERTGRIVDELSRSERVPSDEDLMRLYDSEGVTPELLREHGLPIHIPSDFYVKITARHIVPQQAKEEEAIFDVKRLPPTKLLFYENQNLLEFEGRILKIFEDRYVVLDQTAFYPRSGGQEPDLGLLGNCEVINTVKVGNVIVHDIGKCNLQEGNVMLCKVDGHRRGSLMRHHTATHVINGAARRVLGSWVWQHSAFKEVDRARLDITHYAHLGRQEILEVERLANRVVQMNIPTHTLWLSRNVAEQRYGFRLYQGGVVPGKEVRVIDIEGWDVECCGGTHCSTTGEIGLIKILKAERVQDGVERIEFVAGEPGITFIEDLEQSVMDVAYLIEAQQDRVVEAVRNLKTEVEELRRKQRVLVKKLAVPAAEEVSRQATELRDVKLYISSEEDLDDDFYIGVGEKSISLDSRLVYCVFIPKGSSVKILVFCGSLAQDKGIKASEIIRYASKIVGGSGGGNARFGQGGGNLLDKVDEAKKAVHSMLKEIQT